MSAPTAPRSSGARRRRRAPMRRSLIALVLVGALLGVVGGASSQAWAWRASRGRTFARPADVPARPVALVFGAGLEADGTPSPMLADRIRGAVDLFDAGVVGHVVMSGDNRRPDHDEPTSMRRLAMDLGVPAAAITLDFAGRDTLDTCWRAKHVFGVDAAVVVTQDFHVRRAVATCRAVGIDVVGLGVSSAAFATVDVRALQGREVAATANAVREIARGAVAEVGGPYVGLPGSAVLPPPNAAFDERLVATR